MADNIYAINKANCIFHDLKDASSSEIMKAFKILALDNINHIKRISAISAYILREHRNKK